MKIKTGQILSGLVLGFGLLSLFSVWNIYNWDLLGWGSRLFLFPFLTVISLMAKLSPQEAKLHVKLQLGLLFLHVLLYFVVFNLQDPHSPNLLLLLLSMLLSTTLLIWTKVSRIQTTGTQQLAAQQKRVAFILSLSAVFYFLMGLLAHQDFLLPGIAFEVLGLIYFLYLLLKYQK